MVKHRRAIPLVGEGLERAAHRRREPDWLEAAWGSENVRILVMKEGLPLVAGGDLAYSGPKQIGAELPPGRPILWLGPQAAMLSPKPMRLFLGETENGSPVFAIELQPSFNLHASPISGLGMFEDFRIAVSGMDAFDAGAAATARALFEWHRRHSFCSVCGSRSLIEEAGWKRKCPECAAEHFPRT